MKLVTLGCSWVYGTGSKYDSDNPDSAEEYDKYFRIRDQENAWRNLLSKEYKLENINLSRGGSSNRSQFRRATEFFSEDEESVVLWGITAICRDELWMNDTKMYSSFNFGGIGPKNWKKGMTLKQTVPHTFLKNHYNEEKYKKELVSNIKHWQEYFKLKNIRYEFFETINTTGLVPTTMKKDLLSTLTDVVGGESDNDNFHFSRWRRDCNRIKYLTEKGMVNPYSGHPTKQGNAKIFEFMKPVLTRLLG